MQIRKLLVGVGVLALLMASCSKDSPAQPPNIDMPPDNQDPDPKPVVEVDYIDGFPQRQGDASAGYEYLISGDYMSSGIPYGAFIMGYGEDDGNVLNRAGDNAVIPPDYTAVNASNGVRVVAPNCMQCHAARLNDEFIVGLGNHAADFTFDRSANIALLNSAMNILYGGETSMEWQAYDQFRKSIVAIGPKTMVATRGANPADKITQVLVAQRDKESLVWLDEPNIEVDNEVIPTDVPAWWLLKKKNAMFYHAIGRQDFCKSFIGAGLLTLADQGKAEEIDEKMVDVLAYIQQLEAPPYPYEIDDTQAAMGSELFGQHCASCHGSYGSNPSYPNLLVSLNSIGTDPALSDLYSNPSPLNDYFMDWFNNGWFGSGDYPIRILAEGGYIAPPLDGIWATAPYFHNGSVPTLSGVLDSGSRPGIWKRTFNDSDYDPSNVGWRYTVESSKSDTHTYDTDTKGYGNEGHTFADGLTEEERAALLEYLKTL